MRKIIEITEEVTVGNVVLEKGDKIQVLESAKATQKKLDKTSKDMYDKKFDDLDVEEQEMVYDKLGLNSDYDFEDADEE